MKQKIAIFLFLTLVVYVSYYDLTIGISPYPYDTPKHYEAIEAKGGDTLFSLVEQLSQNSPLPPIETIISDFHKLNKTAASIQLIIGKSYKIPTY